MTNPKYEWIVVGGGINGIAIAEILCRNGHKVLLLEKNSKLASETTKEFHEKSTQNTSSLISNVTTLNIGSIYSNSRNIGTDLKRMAEGGS